MDRESLVRELNTIIGDYLKDRNLDLVDLICRREGRDLVLRILVDKPEGGINLDECAYLNMEVSRILDEKDILQERYLLEVSSPGLDRPLKTKNDFLRCLKRKVKFFFNEVLEGRIELDGLIMDVSDEAVEVETRESRLSIPYVKINKAKQIID